MKVWFHLAGSTNAPMPGDFSPRRLIFSILRSGLGRGIIHRDLKPGDVRRTEDGVATICGSAWPWPWTVPPYHRRHDGGHRVLHATRAGNWRRSYTSVGPVLPRRHALRNGHGTASVYGRRFGNHHLPAHQHLAGGPTWHDGQCPRALGALILRLLAKEPWERPARPAPASPHERGLAVN